MPSTKNSLRLPFPADKDVFLWGPVPGRFFYLSVFCEVHFKHFRKAYGESKAHNVVHRSDSVEAATKEILSSSAICNWLNLGFIFDNSS